MAFRRFFMTDKCLYSENLIVNDYTFGEMFQVEVFMKKTSNLPSELNNENIQYIVGTRTTTRRKFLKTELRK